MSIFDGYNSNRNNEEPRYGEPTVGDDAATVDGETDVQESAMDSVDEPVEGPADYGEPTADDGGDATGDGDSPQGSDKSRRKQGRDKDKHSKEFPRIDERVARKVVDMMKAMEDENVRNVVKLLTGSTKNDPAALVEQLTSSATRKRVAALCKTFSTLADAPADEVGTEVTFALMTDKNFAPILFGVLNALAPDRGFGRPGNDVRKNARTITEKWGDGVDLSVLDSFRLDTFKL